MSALDSEVTQTFTIVPEGDYIIYVQIADKEEGAQESEFGDDDSSMAVESDYDMPQIWEGDTDRQYADPDGDFDKPVKFIVDKERLRETSRYFRALLNNVWKETSQGYIVLKGDRAKTMLILLRVLYAVDIHKHYDSHIREMWHLAALCDKYAVGIEPFKAFFGRWYGKQKLTTIPATVMLWPCWQYDHAKGFLRFSRQAIYEATGYIMPGNPTWHENLHLPVRIVQQLNLARGRIKSNLNRYLTTEKKRLLSIPTQHRCPCACVRQIEFEAILHQRNIWPLKISSSLNDAIEAMDTLGSFNYSPTPCEHDDFDKWDPNFNELVRVACKKTKNYFEGLCLDCMKKRPLGDSDREKRAYQQFEKHIIRPHEIDFLVWKAREPGRKFDKGCRVQHTQPTWYFSLLARREEPVRLRGEENDADSLGPEDEASDEETEWTDAMETMH